MVFRILLVTAIVLSSVNYSSVNYSSVNAATLPPGFTETIISGMSRPTAMEIAPDGRIFVCEQSGRVRVIKNGALNVFPLTVEFAGRVPNFDWLTQIVVRLPDNTPAAQSLLVSVTLRGQTSNKARVRMSH